MSSHDLEGVWMVLASSLPTTGLATSPTGDHVQAGPLLAAVDPEGSRYLLIPLLAGEAARTDRKGRGVQLTRHSSDGSQFLAVVCLLPALHDVFTQFCRELIEAIQSAHSPARAAVEALHDWRTLFADAERQRQLDESALVGLIGELVVVGRVLREGGPRDLSFWLGPSGEVHDMRTASHAIEVKSTLVREGRIVPISSIDQLQEPEGTDLVLVHVRLDRDPRGMNLADYIDSVIDAGADDRFLGHLLTSVNVNQVDVAGYEDRRYKLRDIRGYIVTGFAFPRITRSSFTDGDVPPGVLRLTYQIDLTNEPPHPLSDESLESAFIALAQEASVEVDS